MTKKKNHQQNSAEIQHYNAILIEDLTSKFNLVIEKVDGMEGRFNLRLDTFRDEVNTRFDRIETVLMDHSQKHKDNEKRWEQNEKRWEQNEKRWIKIEKRMDGIEGKLDKVVEKVADHDQHIQKLLIA